MEEIKAPRIQGYLDLNSYFAKRLKTLHFTHDDLYEKGLIEIAIDGINDKFWILSQEGEFVALFKCQPLSSPYAELISEELCKILKMETAHYDLAMLDGQKGVISYNFLKDTDSYDSGFDIISTFYEDSLLNNKGRSQLYGTDDHKDSIREVTEKLNNLTDVWSILEEKYKEYPDKQIIVSTILDQLVDVLLLDILTINVDRHCDNWGIVNEKEVAPIFDSERSLGLSVREEYLYDDRLSFTVDSYGFDKPLEALSHFLEVSSSEYRDRVKEKISLLQNGIDNVPEKIRQRTEYPMPEMIKSDFLNTMHSHLKKVNDIVQGKNKNCK